MQWLYGQGHVQNCLDTAVFVLLVFVPLLQRPCCAYLLLSHLEVLLEIEDIDGLWHDGMDKLLTADNDPARNKRMGCCYGVPNQQQPCSTELVAREVALMESQLSIFCPYQGARYSEMPAPAFC